MISERAKSKICTLNTMLEELGTTPFRRPHLGRSRRTSTYTQREVTSSELRPLNLASPPKTTEPDSIPTCTFPVQGSIDVILPFFTIMCNCTIREAFYQ